MDTGPVELLERESQLASLTDYAQDARRGEGRLVLVGGEAGVGKSALVERLEREVADARWSWGACDGLFTPRPLGPLFDLATQLGGELLKLCQAGADRDELFGALLRQVSDADTLSVLVIEDIHWADEATFDLLRFLCRRLRGASAMVLATYRDDGPTAADPLRIALGDLATQRWTRRINLAPLSQRAVALLADGSGLEAAALYRLTGGNPFYVTEVVQSATTEIPLSARDAVLARAARLSEEARAVLETAALIGNRVELRLLEPVTAGRPAAIDELLLSGLLAGDATCLKFRHEIARLAVEQAVAAHRRGAIHARILDSLRSLGCDDDAQLAFHAEGMGDGPTVLRYATAAANRAAELGSHREAAAQFERALRFAGQAEPAVVAGLLVGLAYHVSLLDRWQEGADACGRALELWRAAGDRLHEGDTMRRLAQAMGRLCRGDDAIAAAETAVSILEPLGPTAELAWAYSVLAGQRMMSGQDGAAIDLAQRAQAIAGPLGEARVLSDALNTEACATASMDDQRWVGLMRRSLEVALEQHLESQAGRAYANIFTCYCQERRYSEAEPYYLAGVTYCDERDLATMANTLRGTYSVVLEETGRWDEAVVLSRELLINVGASPINRLCPLTRLGKINARRGEPGVWEYLDEAMTVAEATGEPQQIVPLRVARAEAYWLEGKSAEATREAELADDVSDRCDRWDRGAARTWLRRTDSARSPRDDVADPYLMQINGDWKQAARFWSGAGCQYQAALALFDSADEVALRQALEIFARLGASATARVTRQRMRALGIRSIPSGPRTATRAQPFGLTKREREVLHLICGRHTNADIAARLFISEKTVHHHVSAVLAKMGAPTRGAAAAQAAELGLVPAEK